MKKISLLILATLISFGGFAQKKKSNKKQPNILVIWGDDIGYWNISAYNRGMMGYRTPNIDRIASEGAIFTDQYAQQSCTAGRSAFALGQHPFRTGLLTIGMPGTDHGIPDWAPTIGDVLKEKGYTTGQFGKNHLGDQDKHLPTNHGFDEFFGNLYHLNAEEEPETESYPKDPEFRKKWGPRGVIHSYADGRISDTGPLTRKRMETVDDEFLAASVKFIENAVEKDEPFFVWFNSSRMHLHTRLKPESVGVTGKGLYPDGMAEHDLQVGTLLDLLDELGIDDNTIVIYSTDNGAEKFTWPDGGSSPFHGEKGTTYEGGMRVPQVVKWPGVIEAGTEINEIMSHEDWLPTLAAAAGYDDVVADAKKGFEANGKEWRVHLDGYNFMPYFQGKEEEGPRHEIYYFAQNGKFDAIRIDDLKISFTQSEGNFRTAVRQSSTWPTVSNLRSDPFETAKFESEMYFRWLVDQMWVMVPAGAKVKEFLGTMEGYPFQMGFQIDVSNLGYETFRMKKFMTDLEEMKKQFDKK
ncbi:arylsulfatase [Flammeovirga sp. SJP92]|uniref:arylsulfatase n=1 Tax=Flammeovirga sp. SJP92 TaxID=1775430 RepID=UPI0007884650|nr:arylsulfatase [Flammeovirga sp. SJP92]KXX67175.1 arylsulfatase [Flammeovirga sp. SJP92]